MTSLTSVIPKLYQEYVSKTPKKLKIIDAYLLYVFLTAVIQFVYCCLVGTFPFNSFLSGFISTVSSFVLGVCLRLQANPENKNEFQGLSAERGFADFIFAHLVLHIVVINFIESGYSGNFSYKGNNRVVLSYSRVLVSRGLLPFGEGFNRKPSPKAEALFNK